MKLLIKNLIKVDGKKELVREEFEGNQLVRGNQTFLEYIDKRKAKMIISYDLTSLKRIAYTNPRTIMHFSVSQVTETYYDSLGWLKIETLDFSQSDNRLLLKYRIFKEEQILGNYQLEICQLEILMEN